MGVSGRCLGAVFASKAAAKFADDGFVEINVATCQNTLSLARGKRVESNPNQIVFSKYNLIYFDLIRFRKDDFSTFGSKSIGAW